MTLGMVAVNAQPATCDPSYWNSLKAKAWTEAEREIEQNQNYIYKADSVLQYTCFDQYLNVLAYRSISMFSSNPWNWPGVSPVPNMYTALQDLVGDSLSSYLSQNFSNHYLGEFSSLSYSPGWSTTYNCDDMKKVWQAAKCQDFANQGTFDGKSNTKKNTSSLGDFFYISDYGTSDYRALPSSCAIAPNWSSKLSLASNSASQYPKETYNVYDNFFNTTAIPSTTTAVSCTTATSCRWKKSSSANSTATRSNST